MTSRPLREKALSIIFFFLLTGSSVADLHLFVVSYVAFAQLAFYVNLHRAVIGPSATLTGRWRPDIDLRRMLTGCFFCCLGKTLLRTWVTSMVSSYMFDERAVAPCLPKYVCRNLQLIHKKGAFVNSVDQDQTPQNAVSDQRLHCCNKFSYFYNTW